MPDLKNLKIFGSETIGTDNKWIKQLMDSLLDGLLGGDGNFRRCGLVGRSRSLEVTGG
jgi:hypothetical protein